MSEIDWSKAPEWADRVLRGPMTTFYYWADDEKRVVLGCDSDISILYDKIHIENNWEVVERRPEFVPGKPLTSFSWSCNAEPAPVTIEQRIASLRALEKKVEETRAELTRDLEALGLTWMVRDEPEQPTITDWRDLRVGDMIEHVEDNGGKIKIGSLGLVCNLKDWGILVDYPDHEGYVYSCPANSHKFRFIRRP